MARRRSTGLLAVAAREVDWIWHDRVALLLLVGVPVLAFAILSFTFGNAVIRDLRVDVVDADNTPTSQTFVLAVNAAPGVAVTRRSADLTGAMQAVRSGQAIAAVYLPRNLERDIEAGRRPQIVIFHNKQYFTPGNVASSALTGALSAGAAEVAVRPAAARYAPGPLVIEQYVLTNPALNYAQFLLRAILPIVLHVVIAIAGGYAVGSEFERRDLRGWMAAAGGDALTALLGKLAPYFAIFLLLLVGAAFTIHDGFGVPFRGDSALAGVAGCLFIAAYLFVGALFQLLARNLPFGLSLTGIFCSPAFGFAGVGFPVLAMGDFARWWGSLLPARWYLQVLSDQAARGTPPRDSIEPLAVLAALAVGFLLLAWLRLRSIAGKPLPPAEQAPEPPSQRIGLVRAFVAEYGRALRDRGAFGLFVLAPIIYGLFYPQPYTGQLVRAIPIAVVDQDSSELSHTLVQGLNAHEAIRVVARPTTLADAQAALQRREVFAILDIPAGTERDVLAGRRARLPAYVDSIYFLLYNRTLQGISEAAGAVNADIQSGNARDDGSLYRAALARNSPVEVVNQPLFNPTGGYASYIVPAAFMLIVQQTVLMGVASLGGAAFELGGTGARRRRGAPAAVLGQGLAHLLLALPGAILFLVVLPRFYGFAATARIGDLLAVLVPFILSVSFLGQLVSGWFTRRETAVLLFIAMGLPLFFLVGVAWPVEAIPPAVRMASLVVPSTSAIDALVRVNQMGAAVTDVFDDWVRLWILALLFGAAASSAVFFRSRSTVHA
ncbi:ABC transporter permease [Reyranella sp.]|uniref:ABC transporter permease n=1 Tax=Reyranella sp. TaxID=1929291 RepID=UPI003D0DF89C